MSGSLPPIVGHAAVDPVTTEPLFVAVVALAALASALVTGLAVAAYVRRRSRPYLLVVLALSTVLVRSVLSGLAVGGYVPAGQHHLVEHGLDVVMAGLVVAAVSLARTTDRRVDDVTGDDGEDAERTRDAAPLSRPTEDDR